MDDTSVLELENARASSRGERDQRMPLLVGLFDSAASRRSLDASLPLHATNGNGNTVEIGEDMVNLDELAAKRTAGGGMLDSIANMANSILGAGIIGANGIHPSANWNLSSCTRSSICHSPSWFFYWTFPSRHSLWGHRLDHPPDCRQCKIEWKSLIYRHYDTLLRF